MLILIRKRRATTARKRDMWKINDAGRRIQN
jgi:hypothetical protein